jgi:hypothetical protein
MTIFERACQLCGLYALVLLHDRQVPRGTIQIVPEGDEAGVYINGADAASGR